MATATGVGLLVVAVGIWAFLPSAGERALYETAQKCGVDESFLYFARELKDQSGRLIAIDYGTDGHSQDFACVSRELTKRRIRMTITQAIDDA
ncbi:hypothetical protein [uncultured Sphingomonas sp.]|uniref:hypothetical protein n=1 Tax=uncultured Sphingomonas sp. TaxID=158754 RepID=UPI0035CC9BF0